MKFQLKSDRCGREKEEWWSCCFCSPLISGLPTPTCVRDPTGDTGQGSALAHQCCDPSALEFSTQGTVGASSSVTRRVSSENVDVIYDISVMFQAVELIQKCGWKNDGRIEPQMNLFCVQIWIWDSIETSDETLRVTELLAATVPDVNIS